MQLLLFSSSLLHGQFPMRSWYIGEEEEEEEEGGNDMDSTDRLEIIAELLNGTDNFILRCGNKNRQVGITDCRRIIYSLVSYRNPRDIAMRVH